MAVVVVAAVVAATAVAATGAFQPVLDHSADFASTSTAPAVLRISATLSAWASVALTVRTTPPRRLPSL